MASLACEDETPPLRVFAAASLTDVLADLVESFDGARVETNAGASSALARQIRDGAPAAVFISASPEWMAFLQDAGALAGEPVAIAGNALVCIAPAGSPLIARTVHDPATLLDAIGSGGRVAIADAGVPAGEYARRALEHAELLERFEPRLVGQRDVRAVLNAVERAELDAGFVYATDARVAAVAVLFAFDAGTHPPIVYQAAVLRDAPDPLEARRFLAHLTSAGARAVLAGAAFALP